MKQEEFSCKLMDKLAGELSENDALHFTTSLSEDETLSDEFAFFEQAWEDMDSLPVEEPAESLSQNFYAQLEEFEQRKENSISAKLKRAKQIFVSSPILKNLSYGAFLLTFGFILGGKFNKKTIVNQTHIQAHVDPPQNSTYISTAEKLNRVKSLVPKKEDDSSLEILKGIVQQEKNTNVRLAALQQIGDNYVNNQSLKRFLVHQLEQETSPLIQVELLNLMIENSQTRESIQTMESILAKRNLNPFVQEKIKKDLPVLRASYVQ